MKDGVCFYPLNDLHIISIFHAARFAATCHISLLLLAYVVIHLPLSIILSNYNPCPFSQFESQGNHYQNSLSYKRVYILCLFAAGRWESHELPYSSNRY